MKDFFSEFLDRAERMLLDVPSSGNKSYLRPVNQTVYFYPTEDEEEHESGEGVSMEGPNPTVAWNNAGTYQPKAREKVKPEKEVKKPDPPPAVVPENNLVFSQNAIANGIIMAEVLGKPLALRHGRR